jgi:hypothetical protein
VLADRDFIRTTLGGRCRTAAAVPTPELGDLTALWQTAAGRPVAIEL